MPEVLCVIPNDFDDFVEEEIPPELKNLIDFEEERRTKPNRLNFNTRGKI